jgi:hypothetical protein
MFWGIGQPMVQKLVSAQKQLVFSDQSQLIMLLRFFIDISSPIIKEIPQKIIVKANNQKGKE